MSNIFEVASRAKLRFTTSKGELSVEDLWDLPLQHPTKVNLDSIALELDTALKAQQGATTSFVKPATKTKLDVTQLKFDVVKHVIDVLVAERDTREQAAARSAKKQELIAALAEAEGNALKSKSPEELRKMIEELGSDA
jgi:hypothetical protein